MQKTKVWILVLKLGSGVGCTAQEWGGLYLQGKESALLPPLKGNMGQVVLSQEWRDAPYKRYLCPV